MGRGYSSANVSGRSIYLKLYYYEFGRSSRVHD